MIDAVAVLFTFFTLIQQVDKNCRRGRVTMRMDGRSRLASEHRCTKGYYRVSPFMKEAK